jgi:hypothetical protein
MQFSTFMRSTRLTFIAAGALAVSALPAAALGDDSQRAEQSAPAIPALPEAALEVLYARPFILDEAYEHMWRKEQPSVSAGYVLVLRVNAASVYPRQTAEPVLYVGEQTAEKVNVGYASGKLVVIVPAPLKEDGTVDLDLNKTSIWFGEATLPEQVDAAAIRHQADVAKRNGIRPSAEAALKAATEQGGETLKAADKNALVRELAALVREHAPTEKELADAMEIQGQ